MILAQKGLQNRRFFFTSPMCRGIIRGKKTSGGWRIAQEKFKKPGAPTFGGEILGGCLDSIYDMLAGIKHPDMPAVCEKYGIFPDASEWRGKLLLLETSELQMPPEIFEAALTSLRERGVFAAVSGILFGRPYDCRFESEYKALLLKVVNDPSLPILCGIPVGHCMPRCIIPFGRRAEVDAEKQVIRFQ